MQSPYKAVPKGAIGMAGDYMNCVIMSCYSAVLIGMNLGIMNITPNDGHLTLLSIIPLNVGWTFDFTVC